MTYYWKSVTLSFMMHFRQSCWKPTSRHMTWDVSLWLWTKYTWSMTVWRSKSLFFYKWYHTCSWKSKDSDNLKFLVHTLQRWGMISALAPTGKTTPYHLRRDQRVYDVFASPRHANLSFEKPCSCFAVSDVNQTITWKFIEVENSRFVHNTLFSYE